MANYTSTYTGAQIDEAIGKAQTATQPGDLTGLLNETSHDLLDHSGLTGVIAIGTGATDAAAGNHTHTGTYQPADAQLTALAGLSYDSGKYVRSTADGFELATVGFEQHFLLMGA